MSRIDRRTLLQGAGGAALALPLLEIMGERRARSAELPKRVLFIVQDNGTIMDNWRPTGAESSFTLGSILSPLQPFQDRLILLDGVTNQVVQDIVGGSGRGHDAAATLLTARKDSPGTFTDGNGDPKWTGSGISIDQEIANRLPEQTRYKSLNVFCGTHPLDTYGANSIQTVVSWKGKNQANPAQRDPQTVFDSLTSSLPQTHNDPAQQARLAQRKSVLDSTLEAAAELRGKLGGIDRQRLDAHLQAIREVESSLDNTRISACQPGQRPNVGIVTGKWDRYIDVIQAHAANIATAFACDLTRVAVMQWGGGTSNQVFPWLGFSDEHHTLSHVQTPEAYGKLSKIANWYAMRFADVLQSLDSLKEGGGSILDRTSVVWINNLSNGATHSESKMGWVLAGGMGGTFRTGRWLKLGGTSAFHSNLLVSLMNGMGLSGDTFGDPAACTGPMPNLA